MSATFAFPSSTENHFGHVHSLSHTHAHSHSHSQSRSHRRTGTTGRLAPPFPLPRIPSASLPQNKMHEQPTSNVFRNSEFEGSDLNDSHFRTNSLIPAPVLLPTGQVLAKSRKLSPGTMPLRTHSHAYGCQPRNVSRPTKLLLQSTEKYSLLHGILAEKDSRRIFYFMLLNLAFMVVQSTYGFLTGSLGLISDSIHMFFDCIALLVGICASVMSKWPASIKFPYGYGKIDTLAGFANGVFLMLISVEIVWEAIERLSEGFDLTRTRELLAVSSLGLFVNIIGIFAFEHGHHGHNHGGGGHSHSHSHGHDHDHDDHNHSHDHDAHVHSHSPEITSASASPTKSKNGNSSGHHHASENMQGIYLHIMADAMGSVAVVASTLMVQATGWNGWDPVASCIIAALVFTSSVPLVVTTAKTLLLSLNSDIEYNLRDILAGVSEIRGVVRYTVPKFWPEVKAAQESAHGHDHGHGHSHGHSDHQFEYSYDYQQHHHDSAEDHQSHCSRDDPAVLGVMHIIASEQADMDDLRQRVMRYLQSKNMDIVVQVEVEGEGRCWCGGGLKSG